MKAKLSVEEAQNKAVKLMFRGNHCGPSTLDVLCQAYNLDNEDFLWAGVNFMGGIAEKQQAPCGALSTAAIFLGLIHRCPMKDKEMAKGAVEKAREQAALLVGLYNEKFGSITCRDVIGYDFTEREKNSEFIESGKWKERCAGSVKFVIEKVYEIMERDNSLST
jgi:hypothetical protein